MRRALLLALACLAGPALAGNDFRIDLAPGWQAQEDVMGLALMARPDRKLDRIGWGRDLLTVSREPGAGLDLAAFSRRKLEQFAWHAENFQTVEQRNVTLPGPGGGKAILSQLRYSEGLRELVATVLVLGAGDGYLTAVATTSPEGFEARRPRLLAMVQSLRDGGAGTSTSR